MTKQMSDREWIQRQSRILGDDSRHLIDMETPRIVAAFLRRLAMRVRARPVGNIYISIDELRRVARELEEALGDC